MRRGGVACITHPTPASYSASIFNRSTPSHLHRMTRTMMLRWCRPIILMWPRPVLCASHVYPYFIHYQNDVQNKIIQFIAVLNLVRFRFAKQCLKSILCSIKHYFPISINIPSYMQTSALKFPHRRIHHHYHGKPQHHKQSK